MYKSIVVAIDGSQHASKAVEAASELCQRLDAKLTICHVKQDGPVPAGLAEMLKAEHVAEQNLASPQSALDTSGNLAITSFSGQPKEKLNQIVAEQLVAQAKRTALGLQVEQIDTRIDDGDTVDAILACATGANADLIVMGRRGLSDLKGLVLGSISHKVASRADCACLTVK